MKDSTVPLETAIIAALKADAGVAALVAARVYDAVPVDAVKPYISIGPIQVIPDKGQDYDGSTVMLQVDGWSGGPASVEVKSLGAAIREALDEATLTLTDNQRLVGLDHTNTQYLVDPDGLTQHAVVTFQAMTEPTA